jgi:asparagine synthase (glutamine-hydrolysing)
MATAIRHRGPDGHGVWHDAAQGIAFAHRRLAIVDLSEAGHQPMSSSSGRYTISFNGEIYNFQELRAELARLGHSFRGRSDTEILLAACEQWGLERAVRKFNGMFAFSLWDAAARELHLVRDRIGKKPIYYHCANGIVAFASELKALHQAGIGPLEVDRAALTQYLRFQYVPAPRSIFENVHKVRSGEIISIRLDSQSFRLARKTYWSAAEVHEYAASDPFTGTSADAEAELEELLLSSVRMRMISDVPLGAFLSGGIDSSLVVAEMQRAASQPVRSFSIGFREDEFDESKHAARIAAHLRTNHTELTVDSKMALGVVPDLPRIFDEPFGDSSQIPTYLVAKLARAHVTVALSGDGGDELFLGYNRYLWWRQLWPLFRAVPFGARSRFARVALRFDSKQWDSWLARVSWLPGLRGRLSPGLLVRKAAETLLERDAASLYLRLVSQWQAPETLVISGREPETELDEPWPRGTEACTAHMGLLDTLTYLPDDILVKVDRASMATSLEARCPLLDYRIVEFAARVPVRLKVVGGQGKALLRALLYRHVPKVLVDRPKTGFGIPLADWLRGPLREWAEALLDEPRIAAQGYFRPGVIRRTWSDFLEQGQDLHYPLWTLLMFQAWLTEWQRAQPVHA